MTTRSGSRMLPAMELKDFKHAQHCVEIVLAYIDNLVEQGKSRGDALDHAVQRFGCNRGRLLALLNDRDFGLMGTSGESACSCVANPGGLEGTT